MQMTLDDARKVAVADPFQIKESEYNVGSAAASVKVMRMRAICSKDIGYYPK